MATRVKLKTQKIKDEREKRPHAHANHIRISPTKIRLVLDIVRGKSVNNALAILRNTPKSASEPVYRLISSAVANAENNLNMSREDLCIAEIYASGGPVLKRSMPRAKGRSVRILKRTSHITVILDKMDKDDTADNSTTAKPGKNTKVATTKKSTTKQNAKKPTTAKKNDNKVGGKKPASPAKATDVKKEEKPKADSKTTKPATDTGKKVESEQKAKGDDKAASAVKKDSDSKATTQKDTAKGEQK